MRLSSKRASGKMLVVLALRKAARMLGYRIDFAPRRISDSREDRIAYLTRLALRASALPGDMVECGMGNGVSFAALAAVAHDRGKALYGFDSFEGFPEPSSRDTSAHRIEKGDWSHVSIEKVRRKTLARVPQEFYESSVKITPGFFSETLPESALGPICFLHLDADLYSSYMDCLRLLYEQVVSGGIIALDECLSGIEYAKYPGGFAAIDDFLQEEQVDLCRDRTTGKYFLVKR